MQVEGFDHMLQGGYPQTLVFDGNGLDGLHLQVIALDNGLGILAAALHGVHARFGHHFHGAGSSIVEDGHVLNPAHAQVLVYRETGGGHQHEKGQKG